MNHLMNNNCFYCYPFSLNKMHLNNETEVFIMANKTLDDYWSEFVIGVGHQVYRCAIVKIPKADHKVNKPCKILWHMNIRFNNNHIFYNKHIFNTKIEIVIPHSGPFEQLFVELKEDGQFLLNRSPDWKNMVYMRIPMGAR